MKLWTERQPAIGLVDIQLPRKELEYWQLQRDGVVSLDIGIIFMSDHLGHRFRFEVRSHPDASGMQQVFVSHSDELRSSSSVSQWDAMQLRHLWQQRTHMAAFIVPSGTVFNDYLNQYIRRIEVLSWPDACDTQRVNIHTMSTCTAYDATWCVDTLATAWKARIP